MADHLKTHIDALIAQHPRFAPCLTPKEPLILASDPAALTATIAAGKKLFRFDDEKTSAQLWLFSLLGSVVSPAVTLMVVSGREVIPELIVTDIWHQDDSGFWCGWRPENTVTTPAEAGENLARSMAPIIGQLCALTGVRPAPLWALVADGVVQPAMSAGNEEFEQLLALDIASQLIAGIRRVVQVPEPRFAEIVDESAIEDLQLPAAEEPEYILAHRVSCCKIYRSPQANLCTSCPLQKREVRHAALIQASRF